MSRRTWESDSEVDAAEAARVLRGEDGRVARIRLCTNAGTEFWPVFLRFDERAWAVHYEYVDVEPLPRGWKRRGTVCPEDVWGVELRSA